MSTPKRILIVDDESRDISLLQAILDSEGYETRSAASGFEALGRLDSSIDLVLLDILMPGMDGLRATKAIREKGFDSIPIIAMTANAMTGDREKCIDAGMNDYISKPIRRENVLEVIHKWI